MHTQTKQAICTCSLLLALVLPLVGCGAKTTPPAAGNSQPGSDLVMIEHNPLVLHNYQKAREYSAAGRYELAREFFLLAYAAAEENTLIQDMLQRELKVVSMMIKTLR